jgi:hypothetical protein
MKIDKAVLKASIEGNDAAVMENILEEIGLLIEQNPFCSRMSFLLANQKIAKKPVLNRQGELSAPNCIGTAFFVAGVGSLGYPYHAYEGELDTHMKTKVKVKWDDCFHDHPERRIPGSFIFSYSVENDGWHAGIYLGHVKEEHISFSQHGHGRKFGPERISGNYCSPRYYIPATLPKIQQDRKPKG